MTGRVLLISNDVVPGSGLPVAGPGIRVHGLAQGLHELGVDTTILSPREAGNGGSTGDVPTARSQDVVLLPVGDISTFVEQARPCTVIITNSNSIDRVPEHSEIKLIVDFFAPKALEAQYSDFADTSTPTFDDLRERKLEALRRADAIIVNGRRKVPYYLGWALAAGRRPDELPVIVVPTPIAAQAYPPPEGSDPSRPAIVLAGYRQRWSRPGELLRGLDGLVEKGLVDVSVMMPSHWSGETIDDVTLGLPMTRLLASSAVERFAAMPLDAFRQAIGGKDISLDAFGWSIERQYAMVTRTVVALACGLAVIHPDFTEVSPLVRQYEAGWLYGVDGPSIASIIESVADDMDELARRKANALELARDVFEPAVAVRPLVELLDSLGPR